MKDTVEINGTTGTGLRHDSATKHVTGTANYTDDIPEPIGTLHGYLGLSEIAHAEIEAMDLADVKSAPGVIGVIVAEDIPGVNDVSPTGLHDEPLLATDKVEFWGQPIFAVIATSRDAARRAADRAKITYRELPHALDPVAAIEADYPHVTAPLQLKNGDVETALANAEHRIKGRMTIGGQDHLYLEGHIAFAMPGEDEDVIVYSSTQNPTEVQHMVAHVLGVQSNAVVVSVRRCGGGFGGKETQMNQFAALAAMADRHQPARRNLLHHLKPGLVDDPLTRQRPGGQSVTIIRVQPSRRVDPFRSVRRFQHPEIFRRSRIPQQQATVVFRHQILPGPRHPPLFQICRRGT